MARRPAHFGRERGLIQLGQKVRDVVSGATGIAVARCEWLYGCVRISIQMPQKADGEIPSLHTCDEDQLETVALEPAVVPFMAAGRGGDRPDPVQAHQAPTRDIPR